MALLRAMSLMFAAATEAASLIWMELSMFLLAASIYAVWIAAPSLSSKFQKKVDKGGITMDFPEPSSAIERELRDYLVEGNHRGVLRLWHRVTGLFSKSADDVLKLDLVSIVESMRKLGHSPADVASELRKSLDNKSELMKSVSALPAALLRDDSVDLLDQVCLLLEERGSPCDIAVYGGLMNAQLRRRDYAGVAATAARLDAELLTVKMRSTLATAAAYRGRLDDALGHIRQMPVPADGARLLLSPNATTQILSLAAREKRVDAVAEELQRIHARIETKQLDELAASEAKHRGPIACRALLDACVGSLQVQKGPGSYNALAIALAHAGDKAGLVQLVEELEACANSNDSGITVGEALVVALLDACKAIHDSQVTNRVLQMQRAVCGGGPASARVLAAACAALAASESPVEACDFYEREMVAKGVWPDAPLTSILLKVSAAAGRTALAQRLMDHVGTVKTSSSANFIGGSDVQRHAMMIKAYAKERDLESATATFNRCLKASGGQVSPLIHNHYLDALVQCGTIDATLAHFEEMKKLDIVDVVGYNTLLKAYLTRGQSEEARTLLREMKERGLQANKVTFNELLHAKVVAKDQRGIWKLVDEMREAGVKSNSVTCSILLKSLSVNSSTSDVKRVTDIIEDMEESIDEVLFSSVIEACIRIQQLDLLSDLMRRYRAKGGFLNLSAPTYGSMIKAYGQAYDVVRVRELWQEMTERGVKPTSITVGCMVESLVANKQATEAWDLIREMNESADLRGCVNTVVYSTVLKGFAVIRQMDKVFSVYKEMRSKNISCNTITYNTMLDACAKCCAMSKAPGLLEDMRESCVEPDIITYSTIVKGYCVEGDVDRAFQVLEEMKADDKFVPDEIMYNSILDGCAKQHRVEDAMRVLEEMKSAGVNPSNYTLSILVKLLGHARRLNQAFKLVEDLSTQNCFRPNVQVYTCLVQACVINRRLEKALALHETILNEAGCKIDDKFYGVLARGCLTLHQPRKALEVVRAAYQLPGHEVVAPGRRGVRPVGVEAKALEDIVAKVRGGSAEDQQALAQLNADLFEHRGLRIGEGGGGSGYSGYGNARGDKGRGKGSRSYQDSGSRNEDRRDANAAPWRRRDNGKGGKA